MVDFKKLVQSTIKLLAEADGSPASAGGSPASNSEATPGPENMSASDNQTKTIIQYLTGDPLKNFSEAFSKKYTTPPMDATSFTTLLNVINKSANQANYVQGDFERYVDVFPYVDFATYVIQEATNNDKPIFTKWNEDSTAKAPKIVQTYINEFLRRALEHSWTLDYPPLTARALILGTDLRKKRYNSVVGEMTLTTYGNKSLNDTIFGILWARKKIRPIFSTQTTEEVPAIREMLLTGLPKQVPVRLASLYDQTTTSQILSIGASIKKLFDVSKALVEQQLNKDETQTNVVTTTIAEFFDNSSLKNGMFRWKYKTTKGQATFANLEDSVDFESVYLNLLQSLNEAESQGELFSADTNLDGNLSKTPAAVMRPVFGKTSQPTPTQDPLNGPKNGYTINTIKDMKNIDSANELYKKLEEFANYIREEEPGALGKRIQGMLSGAADILKGLSFGVTEPGARKR